MRRALRLAAACTACLLGLGALPTPGQQADAQSRNKNWIPIGRAGSVLMPRDARYPRFRRGGRRIQFFVDPNQLDRFLSKNLSTACAQGGFNQLKNKRYYVIVNFPDGDKKRFGFANSEGFNLYDPENRVGLNQVYLFNLDRTSECRVYAVETRH